jgi:hypothetical protein
LDLASNPIYNVHETVDGKLVISNEFETSDFYKFNRMAEIVNSTDHNLFSYEVSDKNL